MPIKNLGYFKGTWRELLEWLGLNELMPSSRTTWIDLGSINNECSVAILEHVKLAVDQACLPKEMRCPTPDSVINERIDWNDGYERTVNIWRSAEIGNKWKRVFVTYYYSRNGTNYGLPLYNDDNSNTYVCWKIQLRGREIVAEPDIPWIAERVIGNLPENIELFLPESIMQMVFEKTPRASKSVFIFGFKSEVQEWRKQLIAELSKL